MFVIPLYIKKKFKVTVNLVSYRYFSVFKDDNIFHRKHNFKLPVTHFWNIYFNTSHLSCLVHIFNITNSHYLNKYEHRFVLLKIL